MKHTFKILTLLALTGVIYSSCKNDNDEEQNPKKEEPQDTTTTPKDTVSWSLDVKPIIDAKCSISGCHANAQSPLLKTYTSVFANRARIKVRAVTEGTMPPSGASPLNATEKEQLGKWIDAGALNN